MMANDWKLTMPPRKKGNSFTRFHVCFPWCISLQRTGINFDAKIIYMIKSGKSSLNSAQTGAVKDRLWISQVLAWTCCYFGDFCFWPFGGDMFLVLQFWVLPPTPSGESEVFPANYHRVAT